MDENTPGAAQAESTALPTPCKDRSAGLTIFGILTILLGCLAALLILLMLFGQAMSAKTTGAPLPMSAILPGVLIYGALAIALVTLGIGSIQARRWARALLLIFSWSWLIVGLFSLVFMAFLMPKMLAGMSPAGASGSPGVPSSTIGVVMVVMFLMFGVLFGVLPAVWTYFYNSRHVKATVEARDPVTRWTDGCPLPVLAVCLWLAVGVPMFLIMPIAGHGVLPFFGVFLSGAPGAILCLALAAIWSYAAWSLYKLEQRGWWLILIALCVFMASALLTYPRHDIMEMYRLMGYSDVQLEQMQKFALLSGTNMMWLTVLSALPFLGYLLFIKKFLKPKS